MAYEQPSKQPSEQHPEYRATPDFQSRGEFEIWSLAIIFDLNYFEEIQAAVFYKKNASKMFKCNFIIFLGLYGSCEQNKNKS